MPRGFRKDIQATKEAHFKDKRSFVALEKLTHPLPVPTKHLILYGLDVVPARDAAIKRSAIKNGEPRCQICGCHVSDYLGDMAPNKLELDHILSKPWNRCWCPENLRILCHKCHAEKHANRKPWAVLEVSE